MPVELSTKILKQFINALSTEIGPDTFVAVLSKSGLPRNWSSPSHFEALDGALAAEEYARIQSALRTYYGRGARGILLRIGSNLWKTLLDDATLPQKARAIFIHLLPKVLRPKPALDLLANILSTHKKDITLHSLDLNLLLVDRTSPATLNQTDDAPICFVTLSLIRECLHWADGKEYDIEERACRALGARQCEFKITIGG